MKHIFKTLMAAETFLAINQNFTGEIEYQNEANLSINNYLNGKRHGKSKCWYLYNNQIYYEIDYQNGRQNGLSKYWHDNGNIWEIAHCKDGRLHGEIEAWKKTGDKIRHGLYANGTWLNGYYYIKQISPKSYFKPNKTISLNYAKYL